MKQPQKGDADESGRGALADAVPVPTGHRLRLVKMLIKIVLIIVVIWLLGDFIYSRVVLYQLDRYEQSLRWDANGVREGEDGFDTGDGPNALLLVHGINFSPIAYRNLAPELARHGFKCRAMRLPGFGLRVREYASYQYSVWVDAIDQEVQELAAKHQRVFIVAHSLGAAIVLRYLADRNPRIAGVVLIAPAIEVSSHRSPVFSTRFWHEFANRTLLFTRIVLSPFAYDMRDPIAVRTIPQKQFTPRTIVDQTFYMIDKNRGQASRFRSPLLMILSPNDQVVDSSAAESYFNAWGSPEKKLVWQERAGHMIPLDYDWQLAAVAIADFVQTHSAENNSTDAPHDSSR